MKTALVQIGNSRGIRIPKPLIEQYRLDGKIELNPMDQGLMIQSATTRRRGWVEAFNQMHKKEDDRLLDDTPSLTAWDHEDWEW